MKTKLDKTRLGIRISRIMLERKVRFVIQDRETLQPLIALSIYEAYLSKKHSSHNTVFDAIQNLAFLIAWARQSDVDIDTILLKGEMIEPRQVNAYGAWLTQRGKLRGQGAIEPRTINAILSRTSQVFRWFTDQYYFIDCRASEREIHIQKYKEAIKERFSDQHVKVRQKKSADDLTEEEILKIEQFLKPEIRLKKFPDLSPAQALRDYLIWRLVIEFGLREGEILALRLEDCPHQNQDHFKIVRIEERGSDYIDPRGTYAPRPKTLSRELGFILKNSPIKKLINDYITKHRRRKVLEHGRRVFKHIFDKTEFLILSHKHDKKTPLSISSLSDIAADIRAGTGIEHFHFHIGRHAFFNRAYASIAALKEKDNEMYKERLRDLIYWGGWESEKSLQLYINRARRERAQTALCFYQKEQSEWEALK